MITFRTLGQLGRFGNQLFQYAGTRLYAELNGFSAAFPNWVGTSVFQNIYPYTTLQHLRSRLLPTVQLSDMQSVSALHRVQRMVHLWHQLKLQDLYANPSDNIDLYGYLQDPFSLELLAKHKANVQSWLHFQPRIEHAYRQATKQCAPWTGVHIRRGDFVRLGRSIPVSAYRELLGKQFAKDKIYVASDSEEIKKELADLAPIALVNPLPDVPAYIFDFWMLAHASSVVGCGSTFSWWAAYLGNKNNYFSPLLTHLWPPSYVPTIEKQII